ncbi:MAG: hypothetical protein JWL90_2914 [Chthoniobacteraceae bacterium]|nr:hypothetical protein [Chthoniobacteraceae bacterium]
MKRYSARLAEQLLVGACHAEQKLKQRLEIIWTRDFSALDRLLAAVSQVARQEASL